MIESRSEPSDFVKLCYWATYYAVVSLGLEAEIHSDALGSGLIYWFPINPTSQELENYCYWYVIAFDVLATTYGF